MALNEDFESLEDQIARLENTITSLAASLSQVIRDQFGDLDQLSARTAEKYRQDLSRNAEFLKKALEKQKELREKINASQGKDTQALKDLQELEDKVRRKKEANIRIANNLTKEGVYLNQEQLLELEGIADEVIGISDETKNLQKGLTSNLGLFGLIKGNSEKIANKIDETGTLSKVLNGELSITQGLALAADVAFAALVKGAFDASSNISNVAKNTGLSYQEATRLQKEFALAALESEKLFLTSKDLNKSFAELSAQTGLIADFGGQTLITQSTLTKQLGLSAEQAGKLSILSRIQSTNTEGILENTVSVVNALSQQERVGINVKGILEGIAAVSDAIAVSLGKDPVAIGEAVAQAKLLGISLNEVDAIASSLLNFEESITNELQAEFLIGKNLNLEKARLLAVNNDLAGLAEEIRNQEEIRLAFANGNRLAQDAVAKTLNITRDQLAKISLQQDLNVLGAERFKDTYGEVTYQQLQSQSASEKFASSLAKIQGIIGDIGIVLAPILDAFAGIVGYIAKSEVLAGGLAAILGGLAAKSLVTAIGSIFTAGFQLGPIAGPLVAAAGAALMLSQISKAKATTVDDMIAPAGYGDRILSTPKGSIALNNQDTIVAGTNLGGDNKEAKETNMLLRQILQKQGTVRIDSVQAGTAFAMNTYQVQ